MGKNFKIFLTIIVILLLSGINFLIFWKFGNKSPRGDGAVRVTNCWPQSCQNQVFSPDGKYVMYTKFERGYNKGPAKLVKVDITNSTYEESMRPPRRWLTKYPKENVLISANNSDFVNVPFGSWIGDKIVFSWENGIAMANDDGSNVIKIASPAARNDNQGQYIEPVFNPTNINEIVFEIVKGEKHQIGLLELEDKNDSGQAPYNQQNSYTGQAGMTNRDSSPAEGGGRMTILTDGNYDDRLPSWSPDGKKILWQHSEYDQDNWQIMTADIVLDKNPHLENIIVLTQGPTDTDNSWTWDNKWILSSQTSKSDIPNIFAISTDGKNIKRITQSDHEDSAPSASPDNNWIAFESHRTKNPNSPTDIWIIKNINR